MISLPNAYVSITEAVEKLHFHNVSHGDLGLRNLIFDKHKLRFSLIDFEYSEVVRRDALKQNDNEDQLTVKIRGLVESQFEHEISFAKDPYANDEPVHTQMYAYFLPI